MLHKIEEPEFKTKKWHGVEIKPLPLPTVDDILKRVAMNWEVKKK